VDNYDYQVKVEYAEKVSVAELQAERDKWKRMFIALYEAQPITDEMDKEYKNAVYGRFM
jgi:hypothetical protein